MEIVLWSLVILLFLVSLAGVVVPFIPDTLPLWAGFLLYQFTLAQEGLPASFWWAMGIVTVMIIGADLLTNLVFVKKYGGSRWSLAAAAAGLFFAPFFLGPLGILVGPFLCVCAVEWLQHRNGGRALKVAWGTLVALCSSTVAKLALQALMIAWFFWVL
ncbi:DUF456 domain-containing protein [Bacillaceae bacterium]